MNEDLSGALRHYIVLMDAGCYFEAHEVLEEAWHPLRLKQDPLAALLKGLINGAVALEHLKRGKTGAEKRAQRVMAAYERHKGLCREGIPSYALFGQACRCVEKHRAMAKL